MKKLEIELNNKHAKVQNLETANAMNLITIDCDNM